MNKNKLFQLVKKEAENLKVHATQEEIANLNFDKLRPDRINDCIYGQMTGDCENNRANKLIVQCCERVYNKSYGYGFIDVPKSTLNGKPKIEERSKYFSPIEIYIMLNNKSGNGNNKNLVDFLKGETDTLTFTPN